MGTGYDHLSREELLALLTQRPGTAAVRLEPGSNPSEPPSSGDRFRQIVEDAADGIFISDSAGVCLDVNDVGARMLGMKREEVIGQRVSELVVDSEQAALAEMRARVFAGEWVLHEWQIRRKDGTIFSCEISAKQLSDGRVQGIWRDVTARREREDALKRSEERFRSLTAAAFEGIGISDHGLVVDVNDQLARLLGYERVELIGKPVIEIVAPESREAVATAIRSGREAPYRHLAVRKDGSRIHVEAQGRMATWFDRPVRVTAIRDITAQLQLEERLNRVQKLEALGRLAGGIAHDFNNILVAIFSYADLTELDADDPTQVRAHMEALRAAAERARDLVQQILTFSRQKGDERSKTAVPPLLQEALRFLRSTLPTTIELRTSVPHELPQVLGAPVQIHQIIMNLCVNAAQAMPGSGVLSLKLDALEASAPLLLRVPDLSEGRGYVRLTVQDTGKGMDSATLGRIFEPFFTTKPSGEGSGLGLAVVHGIVKSHEGAIAVESSPGGGTTFEVYLPVA